MDLLEKHKSNLRYYLQTTDANNIYIALEWFSYDIDEKSTTELETNHLIEQKIHSENFSNISITLNKKCFSASGFYNCNQTG